MERLKLKRLTRVAITLAVAWNAAGLAAGQESATIVPTDYLVLPAVGEYGRLPLHRDAVESQLVAGQWKVPADGDTVASLNGRSETWRAAKAGDDGTLETGPYRGGWAVATFDSPAERVMMLEAAGHAMVYVNREPRAGDPYRLGWLSVPVLVRKGENTLLFHLSGEKLRAWLIAPPESGVFVDDDDRTLPTLVEQDDEAEWLWGAVPVVNATTEWFEGAEMECGRSGVEPRRTPIAPIAPLSVRKVPIQLPTGGDDAPMEPRFQVRLVRAGELNDEDDDADGNAEQSLAEFELVLNRVGPTDVHVRTFLSEIDGSVQLYAVRSAADDAVDSNEESETNNEATGMIVALHGAGVTCEEHVARYGAKSWAHIVAPQGRRPYGFDWEAWGRMDVIEALADARKRYPGNPRRTYLTGHSMGGHGAWHIGVTRPDEFAAIGPSAAWASFWSYGGGMPAYDPPSDIELLLLRGYGASDTVKLLGNLATTGVYVLHGSVDQTVPIEQARFMREQLAGFHPNFVYYEHPSADHWWGDECCDWPRMMDFFRHQTLPTAADQKVVDFTTADPAVANRCYWASIEAQQKQLEPSRVEIRQDTRARTFTGNTTNVSRLMLDLNHLPPGQPVDVTLDGQALQWLGWPAGTGQIFLERQGEQWGLAEEPSAQLKGPQRNGTFNAVFDQRPLLVYGTSGTEEENDWSASKARYDAETFWYRGNGVLEVIPDTRFDFNRDTDRSVILYGNADTNRAWAKLLATCPVEVRGGEVTAGSHSQSGNDLAVVMVRPRPGSDVAMVGVVGGTGPAGMRLTDRLRWFISGIVYPDLMILGPKVLSEGTADVRAWGYFGPDWQIDSGEIAWRDASL